MDKKSDKKLNNLLNNFNILKSENYKYKCNKCKDIGYILKNEKANICFCQILNKKNLPLKLNNIFLSNFKLEYYPKILIENVGSSITYYDKAKKIYNASIEFIQNIIDQKKNIKGLFISGPVGSGKTFLVSAIFNELKNKKIDVEFHIVPEFLEKTRKDMFCENLNENFIDRIKKTKVLILDDLGAHNYTQWTINQLYLLFNYRLNNNLITVITSNYNFNEIDTLLDVRIASRLIELCNGYNLFSNEDIRFKKAKIKNKTNK